MTNERDPSLEELLTELYGPPDRDPPPPYEASPPLTPALLQEAGISPALHRTILTLRPPPPSPTPATSSAAAAPTTTGARQAPIREPDRTARRRQQAIARNRIGAPSDRPISAEAYAEWNIIMTVITERRRTKLWAGWHHEARAYIAHVIPSRRDHLDSYAAMRSLVRRRRRTWKLAEHIVDLDDTLDEFTEGGSRP